ncbi:uncharacterized protein PITG_09133 [Phytophthora infestans T30-4]|uniref:Uncharacterized protein n=1 Tax=Phytophthora infestans (strain T30-4) TaxID=403677 RepID=D0NBS5_PHYIT|nr:uncharacterized protein PITG_09133 [Phytophthora infestans T30-4]EEY55230.1 hypothetical protein PITG_09133 [Phytophthora infestans T30-4]|eukprot:XP_002903454.1 hypothetical protein PITG_09133 [Phytophthora infestans T30-4]
MPIQVAVKVGEIGRTSRANVRVEGSSFVFEEREEFDQLVSKVEELAVLALEAYEPKTVRLDKSIYLKLGLKAPQRESRAVFGVQLRVEWKKLHA